MGKEALAKFNLVDSPWIIVQKLDGTTGEISMEEFFREGYSTRRLAHENPLEDTAILGFLEVILMRAAFYSFAETEEGFDFASFGTEARRKWIEELRTGLAQDLEFVQDYLHREDIYPYFELFDPEHPFMQVANLQTKKGDKLPISKIIYDSSGNHFSIRANKGKNSLTYADSARKLITVQTYDISSLRPGAIGDPRKLNPNGTTPPIGPGWYGKTGKVILQGQNIVETLLLNLPIAKLFAEATDENGELDFAIATDCPPWEREPVDTAAPRDATADTVTPTGVCDVLTWQSRRIRLFPENGRVTNVLICNGDKISDRFPDAAGCLDPWTGLRYSKNQSTKTQDIWMPLQHSQERTFWKGIDALLALSPGKGGDKHAPIKPETIDGLYRYFPETMKVSVQLVGAVYGTQNSVIETTINESIPIELALLTEEYPQHQQAITENSQKSMDGAIQLGRFSGMLLEAAGKEYIFQAQVTESVLHKLEQEFRSWLKEVSHTADPEELKTSWHKIAVNFFRTEANNLIKGASPKIHTGKITENGRILNAATAQRSFFRELKKIFPLAYPSHEQKEGKDVS